jgi:hypothetical protein
LVSLTFHKIKDQSFSVFELEFWHELFLLTDQASTPLLSLFARLVSQGLFGPLLKSSRCQSESSIGCSLSLHWGSGLGS